MPSMRWSLASMFVATALVAVAAWVVRYALALPSLLAVLGLLALPVLLCAAVGTLTGRVGLWLRISVGVDLVVSGVMHWI